MKPPRRPAEEPLTDADIAPGDLEFAREIHRTQSGDFIDRAWAQMILRHVGELETPTMKPDSEGGSADWPKGDGTHES